MKNLLARLLFWRKPDENLQAFAETEAFGARDLARAAEQTNDPWIRRQLILHTQDEVRHARILGEEANSKPPPAVGVGAAAIGADAEMEGIDLEQMGQIRFLTFVHEAEKRATAEFQMHRGALGDKGEFFESILADEKRHVAWTGHALDKLRKEGRGAEIDKAIREMRWERIKLAWLRIARSISVVMSTIILTIIYYVFLWPFTLGARRDSSGWQTGAVPKLNRQF